jgi:transposase
VERLPRQFYTAEFKEEAVKLVTEGGLGIAEASRRLGISEQTLRNWLKRLQAGKPVAGSRDVTELEAEVSKLRRQLAEARMERDILKKAMAYLATEPRRGTR